MRKLWPVWLWHWWLLRLWRFHCSWHVPCSISQETALQFDSERNANQQSSEGNGGQPHSSYVPLDIVQKPIHSPGPRLKCCY
jgi:hypothetical protein